MTRKSITFSKGNADWLSERSNLEDYSSQSDFINALVRKERERQKKTAWLQAEIQKGLDSPIVEGSVTLESIKAIALKDRKLAG